MAAGRLLFATGNEGKARELRALLAPAGTGTGTAGGAGAAGGVGGVGGREALVIETLGAHPGLVMPPEDGETFEANARLKAEHAARALGIPALADDSGLVVDALGGAPGVHSARYAPGSDAARVDKLLAALAGVPRGRRTARFVCVLAFAVPGQPTIVEVGVCEGLIADAPHGDGGFGYDPVFLVGGGPDTLGTLPMARKNELSHRGQAFRAMRPHLARHFSLE